jgi:hypothetical protein
LFMTEREEAEELVADLRVVRAHLIDPRQTDVPPPKMPIEC